MRYILPIVCVLTFCIVCVGMSDALIPLGLLLYMLQEDESISLAVRIIFFVPLVAVLISSFIKPTLLRTIVTSASLLSLIGLWLIAIVLFVVYPMPGNQIPNWVPLITSIPFLMAVIGTLTYCVRTIRRRSVEKTSI